MDFVISQIVVEDLVRRFYCQVEAKALQQHIFVIDYGVSPSPKVLGLLVYEKVRVLLRDATAGNDDFLDLPAMLFNFSGEE